MNAGNLIFLLLIVGGVVAMFAMHRGGHGRGGMGGCCGGHSHKEEPAPDATGSEEKEAVSEPPGTQSSPPALTPAQRGKHQHGC